MAFLPACGGEKRSLIYSSVRRFAAHFLEVRGFLISYL